MSRNSSKPLSQRQLRVGELVRKVLSDMLLRHEIMDPDLEGSMVMVNEVRMSPDLKLATVYISEINADRQKLDMRAKALARHAKFLRGHLGKNLAMKFTPDLRFRADTTSFTVSKIDALLSSDKVQRDVSQSDDNDEVIN